MKKSGHPKYRKILFIDTATGAKFICGSSVQTKEEETVDGVVYPVYRLSISAASHPLFTGEKRFVDAEKRVDKFRRRYAMKTPGAAATSSVSEPVAAPAAAPAPAPSAATAKIQAIKQAQASGKTAAPAKASAKAAAKPAAKAADAPAKPAAKTKK